MSSCCGGSGAGSDNNTPNAPRASFVARAARRDFDFSDTLLKHNIAGPIACGKTALTHQLHFGVFHDTRATLGVDFLSHTMVIDQDVVSLSLWDVAGQNTHRPLEMCNAYFRKTVGVIVVVDASRITASLAEALPWKRYIEKNVVATNTDITVPVVLFVNKVDLLSFEDRVKVTAQVEQFVKAEGFDGFHLTSAKTGENVHAAFEDMCRRSRAAIARGKEEHASQRNLAAK